jgi:hypothetical protein
VIRFSAALVVVAIGVLIAGVATSNLQLVYLAIGVSALALVVLAVGVARKRDELFVGDARPASSGAQERAEQPAGFQETRHQLAPESQAVPGWHEASSWQGTQSGPAQAGVTAGAGAPWAAMSREDSPQPPSARPGVWPPVEPGFPAAPEAASETMAPRQSPGFRRPAPPTRADPVLPWADALPTRVNIPPGSQPEPVPSWLEDVDDKPASSPAARTPAGPEWVDVDAVATYDRSAATREANIADADAAQPEAQPEADAVAASAAAVDDEDSARTMWSTITWDADPRAADTDAGADEAGISAGAADDVLGAEQPAAVGQPADAEPSDPAEHGEPSDPAEHGDLPDDIEFSAPTEHSEPVGHPADAEPAEYGEPVGEPVDAGASEPAEGKPSSGVGQVTVVPGVPRYHDPDCILIRFMDEENVQRTTVADAEKAGCTPCRACQSE